MPQKISRKGFAKVYDPVCFAVVEAFAASKLSKSDEAKAAGSDEFLTVSFKVNGVELNFAALMKHFNKEFNRLLDAEAERLVSDKFDDSLDKLRETVDGAADALRKDLETKFGITISTDSDDSY